MPTDAAAPLRARVLFCEKGCRVEALWGVPETCMVKLNRREVCRLPLYPADQLPEQVQRALNPLKASKKSARKK